jgi:hypothetical protein
MRDFPLLSDSTPEDLPIYNSKPLRQRWTTPLSDAGRSIAMWLRMQGYSAEVTVSDITPVYDACKTPGQILPNS